MADTLYGFHAHVAWSTKDRYTQEVDVHVKLNDTLVSIERVTYFGGPTGAAEAAEDAINQFAQKLANIIKDADDKRME